MAKVIIALVVLAVLGAGAYYWYTDMRSAPATMTETATTTPATAAAPDTGLTAGNSDGELSQDAATIDSQISGFSSDNAAVNSGLNDQPVQQASI